MIGLLSMENLGLGCVPFSKSGFGLQKRDFKDSGYKMKHKIRLFLLIPASSLVLLPRL